MKFPRISWKYPALAIMAVIIAAGVADGHGGGLLVAAAVGTLFSAIILTSLLVRAFGPLIISWRNREL